MKKLIVTPLLNFFGRHPLLFWTLVIVYILVPIDIVPEAFSGMLGAVDDALVVIAAFILGRRLKEKHAPKKVDVIDTTAERVDDKE